ncbi:MAG: c-type cytochrome biogenesis protein CcmI [Candidatus Parabeggiatoa sp. nov. 1]|nr:MAG: c-type cytochrome biogenesis protein CcmI [Gammaproteobacteria bacterium]
MLTFWIIATGLTLLALTFVVPLLVRKNVSTTDVDRNMLNVAIYKERVRELEHENLTPEQLALAKQELEKNLAQELEGQATPSVNRVPNCWVGAFVAIMIPALAMSIYLQLGEPKFLMSPLAQFEDDPQVLSDFADFLVSSKEAQFAGLPSILLESALRIDPNHTKALWLSASMASQKGDYRTTINYLERILVQVPAGDVRFKQMLQKQITAAKQRLQGNRVNVASSTQNPHGTAVAPTDAAGAGVGKIEIHVSLDAALQDKVKPDDTLFIYATPSNSRMPLAIVRKSVRDLPLLTTLDDSTAMTPSSKLSNFQEVNVVARISRSGDAKLQSGDLHGEVSPVILGKQEKVEITINQVAP